MKKASKRTISMYLGIALLAAGSTWADSGDTIIATVPFDFMIGKQAVPSGEYTIRQAGPTKALVLRTADHRVASVFLTNFTRRIYPQDGTKLVFSRYGSRYFLREIWVVGELSGHQLPRSAAEMEASMTAANNGTPDEIVVVAAR